MTESLDIAIASYGPESFQLINDVVVDSGHRAVTFVHSRSMRSAEPSTPANVRMISRIVESLPSGMDLLLPGRPGNLARQLAGYGIDLMVVFGFNWILPAQVLTVPRLGILNVHSSALPEYRGPSPIPWAVRNGDPDFRITVHRMNERVDAGPVLARSAPIPLPDLVSHEAIGELTASALPEVLTVAIARAARGEEGEPQVEEQATYAPLPTDSWYAIDWSRPRERVHHQVRALRLLRPGQGVVTEVAGRRIRLRASSLAPVDGALPARCADGELWLTDWEDA
ncbi:methionyl-tRNA formyltransferase [Glycomyces tarimensis]